MKFLDYHQKQAAREMIRLAEKSALAAEPVGPAQNDQLARMLYPPHDADDSKECEHRALPRGEGHREENVLILTESGRKLTRIVSGKTTYLENRRQWSATPLVYALMRESDISPETAEGANQLHSLFNITYGVMAICRNLMPLGDTFVLVGLRTAPSTGFDVGKISFPARRLKPLEKLGEATLKTLETYFGVQSVAYYPDFAMHRFSNIPSMTFASMMLTRNSELHVKTNINSSAYAWIEEQIVKNAIESGDTKKLVDAFRQRGIDAPGTLEIADDAADTYRRLSRAYPL